ncbi:hypothetical protein C0J52_22769 [Blattella germanica]|nr:hypothetical protein C0J52_22769 [Blattella germanica]
MENKVETVTAGDNTELEQAKPTPEPIVKKSLKEEKSRKKDDKSVEQVLKALNSLDTTEEKLAAMCKKYTDIVDENRKLQLTVKQSEKRLSMIQREKEQLQTEHSKAVLTRSRLESLCRELQRQNKAIKDESLLKIREEEEKRKEVSAKFQSTLNEITTLMQQNNEKNSKLREDNIEMTKKFKTICEQYELREQMCKKICKLEKETSSWKQRWEKSHQALLEMAADKQQRDGELALATRQLAQLQKLCRTLQAERTSLLAQLRTEGAGKEVGGPVTKDVSIDPMQPSQESSPCPMKTASNQDTCRHEPGKDSTSTKTPVESYDTLANLLMADAKRIAATEKTTETVAIETTNKLTTNEDISPEVPPTEASCVKDASQEINPSIASTLQEPVQQQQEADLPKKDDPCPLISDHCANPVETTCPSNETKSDINSNPIAAKEEVTSAEVEVANKETTLVNGVLETNEAEKALEKGSLDNKNMNAPGIEMNHVALNGVEQESVKSPPADNKKGKEGAKKRKNK